MRGRDLSGDLMGRLTFTEYFHLLLTGREPTEEQRFFLDLLLVAIAEHGMMPTNVAARMTLAADPGSLQGAVAAGILGCGPVILGTAEECARLLEEAQAAGRRGRRARGGRRRRWPTRVRAAGGKMPGFGHPVHRPLDPRAERILELADARGVSGPHVLLARRFRDAVAEAWGKPLTMNVSMPIAAVLLDLGFPPPTVKAIPILARTAGLLAHLAEEQQQPDRLPHGARRAEEAIAYERRRTTPDARRPRSRRARGRAARDRRRAYRDQVAYLFERSAFYRDKLAAAGFADAEAVGGLAEIARLPLTEKDELRRPARDDEPIGDASLRDAGRDRPHLLDQRHDRHAELHPAHRRRPRQLDHRSRRAATRASGIAARRRLVSTYNAGPFVAGVTLDAFDRIGVCHIPIGSGNTERLMRAIDLLKPDAIALTPSYALHLAEWAAERDIDLRGSSVERLLVAGEPGGGEPAMRREARGGLGRAGHRGDGHRRHRASRCGANARSRAACTSAAAASSMSS